MKFGLVEQLNFEVKSLIKNYPKFVTSNSVKEIENEIPVFVFHTVNAEEFEEQLKYLSVNGYNTLSVNEYYKSITGKKIEDKSVLLTFDDGRSSFWRIAFPLLKKYKMKATLFVIPGITNNRKSLPSLDDIWQKKITAKEFFNIDKDDKEYCSWEELKIMHRSGLIDIESHTLLHNVVFVDNIITGFIDNFTHDSVLTSYRKIDEINTPFEREKYFGLPIFEHEPLLKGNSNYIIDDKLINYCKSYYEKNKNNLDWQKKLLQKIYDGYDVKRIDFKKKTKEEIKREIKTDLSLSAELIKKNISNNSGNHLCLPWTVGSEVAIEIAKEINYKSVFWGATKKRTNKPNDNPYYNCRIKNDFVFRLPGKGRKSLLQIYKSKISRRVKSEPVY